MNCKLLVEEVSRKQQILVAVVNSFSVRSVSLLCPPCPASKRGNRKGAEIAKVRNMSFLLHMKQNTLFDNLLRNFGREKNEQQPKSRDQF